MTPTQPGTEVRQNDEPASCPGAGQALQKSREVRIGLVLYGGVSLAIYINGVSSEFFQAVRGRGVYRFIKALTDSDVVVDVISGTSAGGINGIFLAFCLCNEGCEFDRSAFLWRKHADFRTLLREPGDTDARLSFLDNEKKYLPNLENALATMFSPPGSKGKGKPRSEEPSLVNELDLFITATDVAGNVSTRFDDAGHLIHVKDHRSVFLLKHRAERKLPFRPRQPGASAEVLKSDATIKALARLASMTSCFPSAFSPVQVPHENGDTRKPNTNEEDAELQGWGRLAREPGRIFLDGGVLDNKPFSYTLRSIFSRHTLREVDRKLCYIEPAPESFKQSPRASQPHFLKAITASLVGIPRYESIAEDLKVLARHNSRVHQYNRILSRMQQGGAAAMAAQASSPTQQEIYQRSRLVALSARVLQGLFREEGRDVEISQQEPGLRARAEALVRCFDEEVTGVDHFLDDLDVTFRLRRLYHTVYSLHSLLYQDLTVIPRHLVPHYQQLWHVLNRQIELHEILQAVMGSVIDQPSIDWRNFDVAKSREKAVELWGQVQYAFERLLDEKAGPRSVLPETFEPATCWQWLSTDVLSAFEKALKTHAAPIIQELEKPTPGATKLPAGRSLLHLFEQYERSALEHFIPGSGDPAFSVRQAYEQFKTLDTLVFPFELVGELHEKDVIEAIRISPCDAREGFSKLDIKRKLSGDMAGRFSGFFKRAWRANDILWGRLDGVCQLVELLLTSKRLEQLMRHEGMRHRLRDRLLRSPAPSSSALREEYDPASLFPRSGEKTHQRLRDWVEQLLGEDETKREAALSETHFLEMRRLLIEAAQLEVIAAELKNVLADTGDELADWKRLKLVSGREAQRLEDELKEWKRQFDECMASDNSKATGPAETALGCHFKTKYTVGEESLLHHVPINVLLDIGRAALPVLQNGLLGILSARSSRVPRIALRTLMFATTSLVRGAGTLLRIGASLRDLALRPGKGRQEPAQASLGSAGAPRLQTGVIPGEQRQGPVLSRIWQPLRDFWSARRRLPPGAEPRAG